MVLTCQRVWTSCLVPQPLARNDGHLVACSFINFKVEAKFWIITLDNDLGGPLDGLRTDAAHCDRRISCRVAGGGDCSDVKLKSCCGRQFEIVGSTVLHVIYYQRYYMLLLKVTCVISKLVFM